MTKATKVRILNHIEDIQRHLNDLKIVIKDKDSISKLSNLEDTMNSINKRTYTLITARYWNTNRIKIHHHSIAKKITRQAKENCEELKKMMDNAKVNYQDTDSIIVENKMENEIITIGDVQIELKGKPFVIGVDTFDHSDWLDKYCESDEEAIQYAKDNGASMQIYHAYDKDGNHIGQGGTF